MIGGGRRRLFGLAVLTLFGCGPPAVPPPARCPLLTHAVSVSSGPTPLVMVGQPYSVAVVLFDSIVPDADLSDCVGFTATLQQGADPSSRVEFPSVAVSDDPVTAGLLVSVNGAVAVRPVQQLISISLEGVELASLGAFAYEERRADVSLSQPCRSVVAVTDGRIACDDFLFAQDGGAVLRPVVGAEWRADAETYGRSNGDLYLLAPAGGVIQLGVDAGGYESWDVVGNKVVYVTSEQVGRLGFEDGGVQAEAAPYQLPPPKAGAVFQWAISDDGGVALLSAPRSESTCLANAPFPVCAGFSAVASFEAGVISGGALLDIQTNRVLLSREEAPWIAPGAALPGILLPSGLRPVLPAHLGRLVALSQQGAWLVDLEGEELSLALLPLDGANRGGASRGLFWVSTPARTIVSWSSE